MSSYTYTANTVSGQTAYLPASQTAYQAAAGAGVVTTNYQYIWYSNTQQVREQKTTLPAVSSSQNGSNVSATQFAYYSAAGNLEWTADQNGRFTHYIYDSLTNRLLTTIADVDAGDGYSLPSGLTLGWPSLPTSGQGASERTDYQYDAQGRVTQTLGPIHQDAAAAWVRTATWTVYDDANHQTRTAAGYATYTDSTGATLTGYTLVNPVSITVTNRDGDLTEQIQATRQHEWQALAQRHLRPVLLRRLDHLRLLAQATRFDAGLPHDPHQRHRLFRHEL